MIENNRKNKRFFGLDCFRVALALLIFMFHSQMHFQCTYSYLNAFVSVGAIAITGFFLLSGFLLFSSNSSLDLSDIKEVKKFYTKRLIAILPMYYSIAVIFIICKALMRELDIIDMAILLPVDLLAIQSTFFTLFSYSHHGGTWFISCIILCYVVFPFLQVLFRQMTKRARIVVFITSIVVLLYAPIVRIHFNLDMLSIYTNPFYRIIEFSLGAQVAQYSQSLCINKWKKISNIYLLGLVFALFICTVTAARFFKVPFDYMLYSWIALPFFILIILMLVGMKEPKKGSCFMHYLSELSFTFFLFQILPLWEWSRGVCSAVGYDSNLIRILVSLTLCFLGAVVIHELIEKPVSGCLRAKLL